MLLRVRRPDAEALAGFLDEYSLGELWEMKLMGGRPSPRGCADLLAQKPVDGMRIIASVSVDDWLTQCPTFSARLSALVS